MSENLLQIKNLHTVFPIESGEVRAVNGITFNLEKGKVLGIVGESGSGKSVTAYSILQILDYPGRVSEGQILLEGEDLTRLSSKQMRKIRGEKISIIFQDPMTSLNPVYTVGNQLREAIRLCYRPGPQSGHERAVEMLSVVGVKEPEKSAFANTPISSPAACASG